MPTGFCRVTSKDEKLIVSTLSTLPPRFGPSLTSPIHTLSEHDELVRSCKFSPDSSILATGDDSGIIYTWDVKTGRKLGRCDRHYSWVTYLHFSPDNKILVTVGENIRWWNIDGSRVQSFVIRGSYLRRSRTDHTFSTFVSIDSAGTLYILSKLNRSEITELPEVIYV
ncbi:putative apoptotic protease-activating factor 1 [Apostichopus japonicus]|uniref:Putative apoptotic protease-activating factor 1 n=1 Tax=Stichopus japonicus TaxID=307972 RepID=A0A2G8LAI2_STIJA|nr:putative apoptotic protease-activating factor 1 [Apostichopus japonicus]